MPERYHSCAPFPHRLRRFRADAQLPFVPGGRAARESGQPVARESGSPYLGSFGNGGTSPLICVMHVNSTRPAPNCRRLPLNAASHAPKSTRSPQIPFASTNSQTQDARKQTPFREPAQRYSIPGLDVAVSARRDAGSENAPPRPLLRLGTLLADSRR
ncbi:hypothetical protein OUZ56_032358 [Daphnia magna]|uniref:Uncharacterized protein n=1 Tax=Daphnia magna TaxID=35525 RepID=A0ABR0B8P3_9CRUS|nr:hypothetical protein OUZ56_032358 [Daphnia magna]